MIRDSRNPITYLTDRYDEAQHRAELAQQVIAGTWDSWEVVAQQLHACCDTVPGIGRVGQLLQMDADPAWVLADIAAKRALLALWQREEAEWHSPDAGQLADEILQQLLAPYGKRARWTHDDGWEIDERA